jgi:hypothetical protein
LQKELKEKRERLAKMNSHKPTQTIDAVKGKHESHTTTEDKKRVEEDGKIERMVIKMVVINGLLNFILRAPDMLFWMENTNMFVLISAYHMPPGILSFIADIGYFSYILTFSTNFVIFFKFNKNFNNEVVFFLTSKSTGKTQR